MATMKSVCIHSFGGPDVLRTQDVERPEPQDDEVLSRRTLDPAIDAGRLQGASRSARYPGVHPAQIRWRLRWTIGKRVLAA